MIFASASVKYFLFFKRYLVGSGVAELRWTAYCAARQADCLEIYPPVSMTRAILVHRIPPGGLLHRSAITRPAEYLDRSLQYCGNGYGSINRISVRVAFQAG
jgi:hypothetical protein